MLPSFNEFQGFYLVLPSFQKRKWWTSFLRYRVLRVLPSFTEFLRVLPSFTEFFFSECDVVIVYRVFRCRSMNNWSTTAALISGPIVGIPWTIGVHQDADWIALWMIYEIASFLFVFFCFFVFHFRLFFCFCFVSSTPGRRHAMTPSSSPSICSLFVFFFFLVS